MHRKMCAMHIFLCIFTGSLIDGPEILCWDELLMNFIDGNTLSFYERCRAKAAIHIEI